MIPASEYAKRRRALMATMEDNSIAIIRSSDEIIRNNDAHYPFRQNSNFYYLTGFNEPEAVMVLTPGSAEGEYHLFNREKNPERELWDGKRAGQLGACDTYLADAAYPIDEFEELLPELLANKSSLSYFIASDDQLDLQINTALVQVRQQVRRGVSAPEKIINLEPALSELRLIKSPTEIEALRHACDVSATAHKRAMSAAKHCQFEYQLDAEITHEVVMNGCSGMAYTSIVGAGENACTLHYIENDGPLKDGDLVLIDAGGEFKNYAADITRTFPVNGRFSEPQKAIYELVLKAQLAGIECIKPGLPWVSIQDTIIRVLTKGLCELGLLEGDVEQLINDKAYSSFYMHNSGHWLGLDVHDAGAYKINGQWRALKAGMVLTVEPGLYLSSTLAIEEKYKGIGVRIEDDILVTDDGFEILSANAPKTIAEIEQLMATN